MEKTDVNFIEKSKKFKNRTGKRKKNRFRIYMCTLTLIDTISLQR